MQRQTENDEYARKLRLLMGNDFEDEVVIAMQASDPGFQRVPRKPHGDGGLDGFSHDGTIAYCCYGPEPISEPGLTEAQRKAKQVEKIVGKFRKDMMLLLELEHDNRSLKTGRNDRLEALLGDPPPKRITHIRLVTSWFDDIKIRGGLTKSLNDLKKKSLFKFVDPACVAIVWDPKDVANNVLVTQVTLARIEQPALVAALNAAREEAQAHAPLDPLGFDSKFDDPSVPT